MVGERGGAWARHGASTRPDRRARVAVGALEARRRERRVLGDEAVDRLLLSHAAAAAAARWPDLSTASSLGQNCHVRDRR